jgi:hypothetical protein
MATACSDRAPVATLAASDEASFARAARQPGEFLAYTHNLVVDTSEENIAAAYQSVVDACSSDQEHGCTILNSSIEHGRNKRAHVTMRIEPEGIDAIVARASERGVITRRHTSVEDLARTITDIDRRISILTTTRDKLIALEENEANDIDSLIKITTELTRVQAELEHLTGQSQYQHQRVDMDLLTIRFVVEEYRSFWGPVSAAIGTFGLKVSEGMGDTITTIADLLPWLVLLFLLGLFLRFVWTRGRRRQRPENRG